MSWGIRITALYLGFVSIIITLVVICFNHKTELEFKDYYSREVNFQQLINARDNADNLVTPITYELSGMKVKLKIPAENSATGLKGSVLFLRPSDSSKDQTVNLSPDKNGEQEISNPGFQKGVYKMQISFSANGISYYKEAVVNFK